GRLIGEQRHQLFRECPEDGGRRALIAQHSQFVGDEGVVGHVHSHRLNLCPPTWRPCVWRSPTLSSPSPPGMFPWAPSSWIATAPCLRTGATNARSTATPPRTPRSSPSAGPPRSEVRGVSTM